MMRALLFSSGLAINQMPVIWEEVDRYLAIDVENIHITNYKSETLLTEFPDLSKYDFIIFDDFTAKTEIYRRFADILHKNGYETFGAPTKYADWELNREKGQEIASQIKFFKIPMSEAFDKVDDAVKFIEKHKKRFVAKPFGDSGHNLTYIAQHPESEDLIWILRLWQNSYEENGFILQEYKEGTEVAFGGFIRKGKLLSPFYVSLEFKRKIAKNLGEMTGQVAEFGMWLDEPKVRDLMEAIAELVPDGNGYFDINTIIADDGIYPLEFTCPRFGFPTFFTQFWDEPDTLEALYKGEDFEIRKPVKASLGVHFGDECSWVVVNKALMDYFVPDEVDVSEERENMLLLEIHTQDRPFWVATSGKTLDIHRELIDAVESYVYRQDKYYYQGWEDEINERLSTLKDWLTSADS